MFNPYCLEKESKIQPIMRITKIKVWRQDSLTTEGPSPKKNVRWSVCGPKRFAPLSSLSTIPHNLKLPANISILA